MIDAASLPTDDEIAKAFPISHEEMHLLEGWAIYLYPKLLNVLVDALVDRIEGTWDVSTIDYLCGVRTCGMPMAALVAARLEKPLIEYNPMETVVLRPDDSAILRAQNQLSPGGRRVLLVDTVVNTGVSLRDADDILRLVVFDVVGYISVVLNADERCPDSPFKKAHVDQEADSKLDYLFKYGDGEFASTLGV